MSGNTFGQLFRITTFGESHGAATGVVIDGCPSNLILDTGFIQNELDRRKPGQSHLVTQRKESDIFEILSGVFEGKTTGAPLAFLIRNENKKSSDYEDFKDVFRPSHADYAYHLKYGHRDYRGGGRASARETAARVLAGAVAKLILQKTRLKIFAYTSQVGDVKLLKNYKQLNLTKTEESIVRCPDEDTAQKMMRKIEEVRKEGDSTGGTVTCVVTGVPTGLGEPVFDKLHADLAKAMLSINAAKGFEYGSGFECVAMKGSEHNDIFYLSSDKEIHTATNNSGGIQGGISNGEDIYFRVAFKPVPTIIKLQKTITVHGEETIIHGKGRHDTCVLPRVVPVVEAMTAMVLLDHLMRHNALH